MTKNKAANSAQNHRLEVGWQEGDEPKSLIAQSVISEIKQ